MHDVGKIAIPKEIINKPGKLDSDEWTIIKTHTLEGQKMLDRVGGFMRDVGLIVRSHHERWDGDGYPDGLAGEAIPLEARIITCCDSWNAMRTDRSYRKALSHDVALAEIHANAGSQFDPRVVDALLEEVVAASERHEAAQGSDLAQTVERPRVEEPPATLGDGVVEDVRAADPVERLLEDSWTARSRRAGRREILAEAGAAALFLTVAVPWAVPALLAGRLPLGLTLLLLGFYAGLARKFPVGAGNIVPSYLVLVPMLLLLPPSTVPLLTAAGLMAGSGARWFARRGSADQLLRSIPNAWHALGPAAVLALAGPVHGVGRACVYAAALVAGCLVDLAVSTLREALAQGIAPRLQARVIAVVWLVDACSAPLGLLVALAARGHPDRLLLLVPLIGLLFAFDRDRDARITQSRHRLDVIAHERTRLQATVNRLGDAFAAKLDLRALIEVLLGGSIDALDADGGLLTLQGPGSAEVEKMSGAPELEPLLRTACEAAQLDGRPAQFESDHACVLGLPVVLAGDSTGALAVARQGHKFRGDEQTIMIGLIERAQRAGAEIITHEELRGQALTDPLTRLGNRRKLSDDLGQKLIRASLGSPMLLMMFDLDGFKSYNDTFGHLAGDALLARLGHKLEAAVRPHGSAYRLGGDEFCVLLPAQDSELANAVAAASGALEEQGERFAVSASCGTVLIPHEADSVEYALQLADKRMYGHKLGRPSGAGEQAQDVLIHIMRAKHPDLAEQSQGVARLAIAVGRRLHMEGEQLDELARAATLHDIGNVGLPDTILTKPGPLDHDEWGFMRQHTVLGERILSAAPALRPVATIVRASHERWDGSGYPDGLRGDEIPLAARIVAACDAYEAITNDRAYRPARSPQQARRELRRQAGRQFDPAVVAALLRELDEPTNSPPSNPPIVATGRTHLAAQVASHVHELLRAPLG